MLDAVHGLHSRGVVHYDLKCDNIVMNPEEEIRLPGELGADAPPVPVPAPPLAHSELRENTQLDDDFTAGCCRPVRDRVVRPNVLVKSLPMQLLLCAVCSAKVVASVPRG